MARSFEEIMADIEKVKADPQFQARWAKYKAQSEAQQAPKGTQPEHHVTDSNNHTRPIMGKGRGSMGAGMGGAANVQFGEQIK